MKRITKSLKISEQAISELAEYANDNSITQAEAVELAIHGLTQSKPKVSQNLTESKPLESAVEALTKQLEVKDEQIAALNAALVSAQDTAKAAQALHAADVAPSLALESQEQKQSRWERLKAAWRG